MDAIGSPVRGKGLEESLFLQPDLASLPCWFVMRDLKRSNAKLPAYRMFEEMGMEVFTPKVWKLSSFGGKRVPVQVPFIRDLLFVHDSRRTLDPIVERTGTLQYRFIRGGWRVPMTVGEVEMGRFIRAVGSVENPRYYSLSEMVAGMAGRMVRIIGGPLDGYEGRLLKACGSRVKRLLVELPGLLAAAVEVQPEYIQFVG